MCGIAGYIGFEAPGLIEQMTSVLTHRGPDDSGYFQDDGIGLGHRRLSIIDLASGHQPMLSTDERYVIVFNGEIYNYRELRNQLRASGISFATESDTEVLLQMYIKYGEKALDHLNGMFAFAIYDRKSRELFLARDRVGIKPLYYMQLGDKLLFSSESKAFSCWKDWSKEINYTALADYLALRYVPGDSTLFRSIRRLPAGHFLVYRDGQSKISEYWGPPSGEGKQRFSSEADAIDALGEALERSVRRRLISDVPVGAYLSGGLDSSLIVAMMNHLGAKSISTFSVGFDYEHDELKEAAATADLLGCNHHTIECGAADIGLLPEIVYYSDDPLGDPISIPMYKLAREAKKEVTVILTGEGADEMFGGYLFHKVMWMANIYRKAMPGSIRRGLISPLLSAMPPSFLNLAFNYPASLGHRGKLKLLDFHQKLDDDNINSLYLHLISLFDKRDTQDLFTAETEEQISRSVIDSSVENTANSKFFDRMLRLQFPHWLPDNMLLRQDKMSMASGIEGRVPFLDHELIEFAFSLPRNMHLRRLTGKYCLRKFAQNLLPRQTAHRRKMPFYVPMEGYFGDRRFIDMMEDLIGDSATAHRGIFNLESVEKLRKGIHAGEFIQVKQVFSLMTLELWFRQFVDGSSSFQ